MKRIMRHTSDGQPALELRSESSDDSARILHWKDVTKATVHVGDQNGRACLYVVGQSNEEPKPTPKTKPQTKKAVDGPTEQKER